MAIYGTMRTKIPRERIAVCIGTNGETKKHVEDVTHTKITIDSADGTVLVESTPQTEDPLAVWRARDIVLAIGRGFSPKRAFKLLDEDMILEVIFLDASANTPKALKRIRGRLIGERGKTRRIIEEFTGASLSIFGHSVAIIGTIERVTVAKEAIQMILKGMPHKSVYSFLDRKKRELKKAELSLWKPASDFNL
ncbi:MAG: KH domain-containing protein [Promethearchaeota archaeon]